MTKKQAWTAGYQAQIKEFKVFDNPETGANRVQWYDGYAASERETFVLTGQHNSEENKMRYELGFQIGSEDDDGGHRRDLSGWPYSIYRQADEIGATDAVLCHGIQNLDDAKQLLALANGDIRPPIMSGTQIFAL